MLETDETIKLAVREWPQRHGIEYHSILNTGQKSQNNHNFITESTGLENSDDGQSSE